MFDRNMKISRITLGTAQLGLQYGIANKDGKPDLNKCLRILKYAFMNKINCIDTASCYGDSELRLGHFLNNYVKDKPIKIVTKTPSVDHENGDSFEQIYEKMKTNLAASKERLCLGSIPIYLLHDTSDLHREFTIKSLIKLKVEGLVEMVGVSVYNPEEAIDFLKIEEMDVIQIPVNLFDTRFVRTGLIDKLAGANKKIFVRSIFLQGLFFLKTGKLPKNLRIADKYLRELVDISQKHKISILELAFNFVRDIKGVDSLVVGVDNEMQLRQIIELLESPSLLSEVWQEIYRTFCNVPDKIINPSRWDKRFIDVRNQSSS